MTATGKITLNDLYIFFAKPGNLVGLVVLPLAFTLVLGWAFGGEGNGGPQRVRVDVLDQDRTDQSARLLDELRAVNDTLVLCPFDNDEGDFCRIEGENLNLDLAVQRAREEVTSALIVIPSGYGDALSNFDRAQIEFYAAGDPNQPNVVQQSLNAVLQRVNTASLTAGVTGSLLNNLAEQTGLSSLISGFRDQLVQDIYDDARARIQQRPDAVQYVVNRGANQDSEAQQIDSGFGQSVPGMGAMYVMFTVLGGIAVLLRERRQWTLQRLAALPVTRAQILGGKVLTYFILGMIQFLIVFAVGIFVGLDFGDRPLVLLPVMLAFTLCCTGLTFAIAPYVTSEDQASGITTFLALSLAPLGGAWWPLEIVPDFMQTIGYLSPVAWAMQAFHDVMWYDGGLVQVLPEVGVLIAAGAVLFAIGVRAFRYV